MVYNCHCNVETEGLPEITSSRIHCKCGISETAK